MELPPKSFHVVQVFKNCYKYDKSYKDYELRKEFVLWKDEIESEASISNEVVEISNRLYKNRTGIIGDLMLIIDNNYSNKHEFDNLRLINKETFVDNLVYNAICREEFENESRVKFGQLRSKGINFEIFKIKKGQVIEFHLNWDEWKIGFPIRENYKLIDLKLNRPVEIKVNGKRDFSMTGRGKRTFYENNYILEYKGIFSELRVNNNLSKVIKRIPKISKQINLLKQIK